MQQATRIPHMLQYRFDYCASVYLFHPLRRLTRSLRRPTIPILMYHSVDDRPRTHYYYDTHTSRKSFADQMTLLDEHGYNVVSLDHVGSLFSAGGSPKAKTVAITFDDGYRSILTNASSIMRTHGFTATVFLPTACIGERQRLSLAGRECLTWEEVRELQDQGIAFGTHTVNHRHRMETLNDSDLMAEIGDSKAEMERRLGARVRCFSHPYAFPETDRAYRRRLHDILLECGIDIGVTTILGTTRPSDDLLFLPRIPINTWDDSQIFQAKLEGGYDWLRAPQYLWKLLKKHERQ